MMQFLKSIPLTFYSRDFYIRLIRRGCGIGAGFMLLQGMLLLVIPTIQLIPMLPTISDKVVEVAQKIPQITIKDQKLSIDKASPYTIDLTPDSKTLPHPIILFDTTSTLTNITDIDQMMKTQNIMALVTTDYLAMPQNTKSDGPIKIYSIRDFHTKDSQITHEQWNAIGQKILAWGGPLMLLFMAISLMIVILVITFLKGLLLLVLTLFCTLKLSLANAMRLSAATSTPGSILLALCSLAHIPLPPHTEMALWLLLSLYGIIFTNKAAKAEAVTIH